MECVGLRRMNHGVYGSASSRPNWEHRFCLRSDDNVADSQYSCTHIVIIRQVMFGVYH